MRISILQPGYLPWLGFFEQVYKSDIFIIYDDVQYDKHGWRNRNRIKTAQGIQWLTVPVHTTLKNYLPINEVKIDNTSQWRKKHLLTIKQSYSKADYFNQYVDLFEDLYSKNWELLIDLDLYCIDTINRILKIDNKKIVRSSSLNISGDRIERLIKICKKFNCDSFYEGSSGKNYIDSNIFFEQGIKVEFQDYIHPVYRQLYGEFIPYLSIIDLLFNHGEKSLNIIISKANQEVI